MSDNSKEENDEKEHIQEPDYYRKMRVFSSKRYKLYDDILFGKKENLDEIYQKELGKKLELLNSK